MLRSSQQSKVFVNRMKLRKLRPLIRFTILFQLLIVPIAFGETVALRIGTGGSAGTYFPIGSLISEAITSAQIQLIDVDSKNTKVVAIAQRSNGSVANVNDIENGLLEGALTQADIGFWAYHASGPFSDGPPRKSLRTIASLYSESVHLISRTGSGINSIGDLVGKKVSIDEIGSGTLHDVKLVLSAFGIELEDIDPVYLKPEDSIERFRKKTLDAFILVAGYPVQQVADLVREGYANVVPIDGPHVDNLVEKYSFFSVDSVPEGTYQNGMKIKTVSVSAQFIVNENLSEKLVYEISKALWNEETAVHLANGHPKGKSISIENAVKGISIPLHAGAKRFYQELQMDISDITTSN